MRRKKEKTGGQVARNYFSFLVYMMFWHITQTDIPEPCTFDTGKSESKIFTPFPKPCIQETIRKHATPKRERKSVLHPPGLYYGNDDRLSLLSNIRTGTKQRHKRFFNNFSGNTSRSASADSRSLNRFDDGSEQNCPKISTRSCGPKSGYKS
jgi:hypothetical protein